MLPTPGPRARARLPQQNPQVGYTAGIAETPLPASGRSEPAIPHYLSRAFLCPLARGSQLVACFSCAVGTATACAPKQGAEARPCKRFGSNNVHGARMTKLGSKPGLPEPEQVGALTAGLPFISQH